MFSCLILRCFNLVRSGTIVHCHMWNNRNYEGWRLFISTWTVFSILFFFYRVPVLNLKQSRICISPSLVLCVPYWNLRFCLVVIVQVELYLLVPWEMTWVRFFLVLSVSVDLISIYVVYICCISLYLNMLCFVTEPMQEILFYRWKFREHTSVRTVTDLRCRKLRYFICFINNVQFFL